MDQDVDLLAQRVEKQRAKLDEEATLLDMTEKRVTAADSDRQSAGASLKSRIFLLSVLMSMASTRAARALFQPVARSTRST